MSAARSGGAHRYAMIMAGGSGTRLWPMSRAEKPKQLIPFIGGNTLLASAARRIEPLVGRDRLCVCAAQRYKEAVVSAVPGLTADRFFGEPEGRDTLNAVGFTAAALAKVDPDAIFVVLTSDHLIEPQEEFARQIDLGFRLVEASPKRIVTFAIKPTFPATSYGYVEAGAPIAGFEGAFKTARFVEKPNLARARQFLASGAFAWNSGMFVFHARTVMEAIGWFRPENKAGLDRIGEAWGTPQADAVVAEVYPTLGKISVDHGLMEPIAADPQARLEVCTVPMALDWKDVGSWPTYGATLPPDAAGNMANARTMTIDAHDNIIVSDDPTHMIAAIGVDGLVIVHTRDATLVCRAEDAERVKELAARVPTDLK